MCSDYLNDAYKDIYCEINDMRKSINDLEMKIYNMRFNLIQVAISSNWNKEDVKRVLGATDDEVEHLM